MVGRSSFVANWIGAAQVRVENSSVVPVAEVLSMVAGKVLPKFESQIVGRTSGGGAEHGWSFVVCRELDCGEGAAQVRVENRRSYQWWRRC